MCIILDECYSLIWFLNNVSKAYKMAAILKEIKYFIHAADPVQIGNTTCEAGVRVFLNAHSAGDFVQAKE